jgi:uncharacterized protein YndB with AHSA1/START domain
MSSGIALVARRTIRADVHRVFDAWTQPTQLRAWWGPRPGSYTRTSPPSRSVNRTRTAGGAASTVSNISSRDRHMPGIDISSTTSIEPSGIMK